MRAVHGRPRRLRVCLATDSLEPSGVGEHILLLAEELAGTVDVVIAAAPQSGLLDSAGRRGFALRDPSDVADFAGWLGAIDILHVHAGIGWEGHELARLGRTAGVRAVVRTEHLPYVITDPAQARAHAESVALVDRLICVSSTAAASFGAVGLDSLRIVTIPNGVRPRPIGDGQQIRRELALADDAPVLLTVARFTEQKGHAVLIAALPAVLLAYPEAMLLLAGAGPLRPAIEADIARRGLGDRVRLLGSRDDVGDLLAAADLFVLPSHFEGLPLVVLEAMAAAVPVVGTAIGGTIEAVEDGVAGWLVPPGEPAALSRAVIAALSDPSAARAAGCAGQARFRRQFQASAMAEATHRVYRDLVPDPQQDDRMPPIRIGFIGAGGIAHRHLGVLEGFDDVAVVAFADTDLARATEAAARFGAKAFDDHETMLDAVELDALFICIPPFAHGAPERAAIARGLPFFVEKPVSLDLATAEEIAAAVAEKGLITAVGYHWRYLDTVDEARALLANNPAQLLSGYWLDSTPPPQWWWHEDRSGGQMVEQATHLIDLARFLVGEVDEVYGRASRIDRPEFPGLDVATVTTANLTFASGVVANLSSTCLLGWSHRVGLHIFADKLAIELTDRDIMVDTGRGRPVRGADGDPVWREDRDFIDAVKGGENRIRSPYAEALRSHRLALAVVESASSGAPVKLTPDAAPAMTYAPLQHPPRPAPEPRHGHREVRSLGVERPGEAYFFGYDEGPPNDAQVRLDTLYTGFSAGTELTFYKNTNPYLHSRWDGGRGVFVPGEAGQHFPVPFLGYMEVARVAESRQPAFAVGSTVASAYGHKSGHTADPFHEVLIPVPADIDPILGIYVAQMGPIAANGILHADAELGGPNVTRLGESLTGRPTLVIGAGAVGLLTALFAARAGATEVVIADPSPFRRAKAEALGFTAMDEGQAWNHAKANWHHGGGDRGADVVFQTRADARSLHAALQALRPQGTVIDLAFYQGGADALRLGEEFHHNGLSIRCAQINRVPRGLGFAWHRRRLAAETIGLLQERGRDIAAEMITQVVPFDEAPRFLKHLVDERPDFLQIVFKVQD
ncbi:glycosyltransferase [Aureimonas glaciei]|uniref:Glycosyl transferase family 1 n=1 Tax=Aureimonas glaciei TaxID=1776957 RepID=A0A916XU47_9HYPH|nr:glycosyltransferase [Aureimonas glaciei]GGD08652.1 glycosyl transferase family 1 [Aureimonas glaciei]